jgi:ABC-type protease/lipase transport system fused ATPase/permease subunit
MRHARPAFSALSAQVWRAAVFAVLFTLGAGLLALALPFVVMHAIEAAERRQSLDGLLFIAGLGMVAAMLRSVLLAARDRLLLQAALWLDHIAGSAVLTDRLDRGVMPEALDADRTALDRCVQAIAGPAVASLLDALAAVVPLTLLFLIHPALGAVSLLFVASFVASALVRARASILAHSKAASARAAADRAWRTAAANGPMIAARRMSAGIVADWETLSRVAVVSAYGFARPARQMAAILRAVDLASCVVIAMAGVCLVQSDSLTLAGLAAAVVLHVMLTRAVLSAHDRVPELAGLEAALLHLGASPVAMADRAAPVVPTTQATATQATAPVTQAPVAATPTHVPPRIPAHPARPTFEPAAPLPTARPPAAYGIGGAYRGGL